ncbi:hypothetical protein CSUI_009571, partial [Cystoisospora suis]
MEDYLQRHRAAYERRLAEQRAREEQEKPAAESPAVATGFTSDSSSSGASSSTASGGQGSPLTSSRGQSSDVASEDQAGNFVSPPANPEQAALEAASVEEAKRLQRQFEAEMEGIRPPDDTYQECLLAEEPHPATLAWWDTAGALPLNLASSSGSIGSRQGRRVEGSSASRTGAEGQNESGDAVAAGAEEDDEALARRLQEEEFQRHSGLSPPAGTGTPQAVPSLSSTPPLAERSSSPAALAAALARREPAVIDVDRDSNSEVQVVSSPVRSSASSSPSASSPARANRQFARTISPSPQQPALDRQAMRGRQQSPQRMPPVVTDEEVAASAAAAGIDVDSEVPPSPERQSVCSLASELRALYTLRQLPVSAGSFVALQFALKCTTIFSECRRRRFFKQPLPRALSICDWFGRL